jgi:hypothetical protein
MNKKIELGTVVLKPVVEHKVKSEHKVKVDTPPLYQLVNPSHKGESYPVLWASTIKLK